MHHTVSLLLFSLLFFISSTLAQSTDTKPSLKATRVKEAPKIDGQLNDKSWESSEIASNFKQLDPVYKGESSFKTEVRIIYDDKAIYVAAKMLDPQPDSIYKQLGVRDSEGLNVDAFYIGFDTYQNRQDAYVFGVTASGVQMDKRSVDPTYNTVWKSAVEITSDGWNIEMSIPYSALRFPTKQVQDWGLQLIRHIRRYREEDQWAIEEKGVNNNIVNWGSLTELSDINPPLRLSFLPYVSAGITHNSSPELIRSESVGYNYNGGMDLKWGLNESFTLDMILMPDFSQVQSDKIEKNLSAFEQVYDENRPFFNEGTDLFQKGNLFYSRRIGRTPLDYYSVEDSLADGEVILTNPKSARLLNALKLSGRTSKGLGVGFFNAITGNTWATISDTNDNSREVLTDPMTNYNIIVLDQNLPNNSSVYFINTNVTRPDEWKRSNVYGAGFRLSEKSNTYQLNFDFSSSDATPTKRASDEILPDSKPGIYYMAALNKIKGNFRFSIYQNAMNKYYDRNDLGVNRKNDELERGFAIGYNIYEPFSIFRFLSQTVYYNAEQAVSTRKNTQTMFGYKGNSLLTNYLFLNWNMVVAPYQRHDYYEPRETGRVFLKPGYALASLGFSSDYRRSFAIDGNIEIGKDMEVANWSFIRLCPILRVSDKFKMSLDSRLNNQDNQKGYVTNDTSFIYFGNRDVLTNTNTFSGQYMFNNKLSLGLMVRHYWQRGEYDKFYTLNNNGSLSLTNYKESNPDYNYNSFNLDLVLGWEFSPGSIFNLVWKNAIQREDQLMDLNYMQNFDNMINSSQMNNLSIKFLYYLDYQMMKNWKTRDA